MILRLLAISLVITVLCFGDTHSTEEATQSPKGRPVANSETANREPSGVVLESNDEIVALQNELEELHHLVGKPNNLETPVGEQATRSEY